MPLQNELVVGIFFLLFWHRLFLFGENGSEELFMIQCTVFSKLHVTILLFFLTLVMGTTVGLSSQRVSMTEYGSLVISQGTVKLCSQRLSMAEYSSLVFSQELLQSPSFHITRIQKTKG